MSDHEGSLRTGATITEDPATTIPVGSTLRLLPALFPADKTARSGWVRNWDHFLGVMLSISFADREEHRIWGSAVAVGPGVTLAARHVVEPESERLSASELGSVLIGIAPHGAIVWRPHHMTWSENSDIAIICSAAASEPPPNATYHQAVLTTRVPKIGEPVMVVGFVAAQPEFKLSEVSYSIHGNVVVSCGMVIDHFPEGHRLRPWPMIVINAETSGGISGGPAFDEHGRLIGVLCSGANGDAYSMISLVEPALSTPFPSAWMLQSNGATTLRELAARAGCFLTDS